MCEWEDVPEIDHKSARKAWKEMMHCQTKPKVFSAVRLTKLSLVYPDSIMISALHVLMHTLSWPFHQPSPSISAFYCTLSSLYSAWAVMHETEGSHSCLKKPACNAYLSCDNDVCCDVCLETATGGSRLLPRPSPLLVVSFVYDDVITCTCTCGRNWQGTHIFLTVLANMTPCCLDHTAIWF